MNEVLSFYQKQAQTQSSNHPMLAKLQSAGLSKFVNRGFPTRRDEAWKYSPPDLFLQERFELPAQQQAKHVEAPHFGGQQLHIENGQVSGKTQLSLPEGCFVGTFEEALTQQPGLLEPYLGRLSTGEHGFQALNTAMLQTSLVIYLPKHQTLDKPLTLSHWQNQINQAVYARYVVILEKGAQLTLIEDYAGAEDIPYLTNSVTEVFLSEAASLNHIAIQRESAKAFHLSHVIAHQAAASHMKSHAVNVGAKWARVDKSFYLQGTAAKCLLNGIYGLPLRQHLDQHTFVHHAVSGCESEQDYKGLVTGPARAVFNGRILVEKDAQQTKAMQQNKNLLLSKEAEVDTKPQLEIYANDVICSHGATVGQLSEEALFYFLSRGISEQEARRFLMDAFTATNLALIEDQTIRAGVSTLLHDRLS